jgi:diacylglycerol kinase family enzyme
VSRAGREIALLCDPSAGDGRAARALPQVEEVLRSLGLDSDANRIANAARSRLGRLVYACAALRALAAWRPARLDLRSDGEPLRFWGHYVAAAVGVPDGRVLRARELHVDADRPFVVYADGDPIASTPVTIRIQPGALQVLVPA